MASGTTFLELSGSKAATLPIPLPPLAEQRRIVAKLDEVMGKIETARARLERVPRVLKRFRQSVLAAACSGRLTADWRAENNATKPKTRQLRSLVLELGQGWSPGCELNASPSPDVWGVIKTTSVQAIKFLENENKQLPAALTPRPKLEIKKGDLLITRAGVCCLMEEVRPKLMICDKVYRVRFNQKLALPQFVVLALNTPEMVEHIDTLKTGSSDSGLNLTQERFLNIEISLPSIEEQREIVRRVEALFALADSLEARHIKGKRHFDRLPASVLTKAFRGELVPQNPDDENAQLLLERLRAARETAPAKRTRDPKAATKQLQLAIG